METPATRHSHTSSDPRARLFERARSHGFCLGKSQTVFESRLRPAPLDPSPKLRSLLTEHGAFVCRSLRHLGVAEPDLDDSVHEVFSAAFQRLHDYKQAGRARAHLYAICTRVARAHERKLESSSLAASMAFARRASAAASFGAAEDHEAYELSQRALLPLSPQQREVFWLYEVEDMRMVEIAHALECPLQTAYSRLHEARERVLAEVERIAAEHGHD